LTRLLVTARETDYAFAVVGRSGSHGDVTGFYSHRRAHVVFICLKGSMRFWVNDQCRTMTAGDCVSVPPVCRSRLLTQRPIPTTNMTMSLTSI
jgi:quercetin dioxygenase-like cupin family protein